MTFHTDPKDFRPYARDPETLARPWVRPGTPGLEHRVGGLEKEDGTGNVSYDPENHERMVRLREEKVQRIVREVPDLVPDGPEEGDLLVVGWGSTHGAIHSAVRRAREQGLKVAHVHLRHLNPLPANLGAVVRRYRRVLVPENNRGQLLLLLRARFLVDAVGLNKVQGLPFRVREILARIRELCT